MSIKLRIRENGEKVYDIRVQYGGVRKSKSVQTTKSNAKRIESKMLNELMLGRFEILDNKENPTFRTYAERYRESVLWHKSHARTVISINHLKDHFGAKRLTELTLQDFINYRSKRLKKVTPATVNREHTCFLRMLNVAVSDDSYQIYKNPIKGLKKFKEKPVSNRILSLDEYHKLLDAAPEYFRRIVNFACNTGFRKMEILNLTFGQLNVWHSGMEIELLETKSGNKEHFPLNPEMQALLNTIAKEKSIDIFHLTPQQKNLNVFDGLYGNQIRNIRRPLEKTFEKAGIEKRPFHTFRHFWTKMMFESGIDPATIQKLGRWGDFETMLKYCYTIRSQERDAINKLSEKLNKKPAKIIHHVAI